MEIIILTEGDHEYGLGHIIRCTSFYDEFKLRGHEVSFIIDGQYDFGFIIEDRNYYKINWLENINKLDRYFSKNTVLFFDSNQATQKDVDYLRTRVKYFVVIDDYKRRDYKNTIILDWTTNIEKTNKYHHNLSNGNQLLLGLSYSVLRKPFRGNNKFTIDKLKSILITMGGTDVRNLSLSLIDYLHRELPNLKLNVVIGPGTTFNKKIQYENIKYYYNLDAKGMKNVMELSDLAITAGGETINELISIGVPSIAVMVADNQKENLIQLYNLGLIVDFFKWNDPTLYNKIKNKIIEYKSLKKRKNIYGRLIEYDLGNGINRIMDIIEDKISMNIEG